MRRSRSSYDSDAELHDGDPASGIDMSAVPGDPRQERTGAHSTAEWSGWPAARPFSSAGALRRCAGTPASGRCPGAGSTVGRRRSTPRCVSSRRSSGFGWRPDCVVGWLDDYATRSGFVITPVVLWCDADAALEPDPDEVFAVYRVGLQALMDGEPRYVAIPESDRPVVQVPLGNDLIHAPTARSSTSSERSRCAGGSVSGSITWRSRCSRGGDGPIETSSRRRKTRLASGGLSSSGGGIRTRDLRVMSPTSYLTAPPRGDPSG